MSQADRMRRVAEGVRAEADVQFSGAFASELRSPLYEALARHIADEPTLVAIVADSPHATVRSLLAAVHLLLLEGSEHSLRSWYPTVGGHRPPDDELPGVFDDFVAGSLDRLQPLMRARGVQTNEVRRSATLLLALGVAARQAQAPIALIELGASAGLNLLFDRYRYRFTPGCPAGPPVSPVEITCELRAGQAPIPDLPLPIASRVGVDLDPVAVADAAAVRWLRACIWGDHPHRLALLDAAVSVALDDPPQLMTGDMVEALPDLVAAVPDGITPVVFHTSAVNYLRRDHRRRLVETLNAASTGRRLLWLSGEGPGILPELPAPADAAEKVGIPVVLTDLRNGTGHSALLALAGVQGSWIEWNHDPSRSHPG